MEFEAEAVAWIVCARQGLDPGSYRYLDGYLVPGRSIPPISLNELVVAANHIESLATDRFRAKPPERKNAGAKGVKPGVSSATEIVAPPPLVPATAAGPIGGLSLAWRRLVHSLSSWGKPKSFNGPSQAAPISALPAPETGHPNQPDAITP